MQFPVFLEQLASVQVYFLHVFLTVSEYTVCVCNSFVLRLTLQPWLTMFYSLQNQNSVYSTELFKKRHLFHARSKKYIGQDAGRTREERNPVLICLWLFITQNLNGLSILI